MTLFAVIALAIAAVLIIGAVIGCVIGKVVRNRDEQIPREDPEQ